MHAVHSRSNHCPSPVPPTHLNMDSSGFNETETPDVADGETNIWGSVFTNQFVTSRWPSVLSLYAVSQWNSRMVKTVSIQTAVEPEHLVVCDHRG